MQSRSQAQTKGSKYTKSVHLLTTSHSPTCFYGDSISTWMTKQKNSVPPWMGARGWDRDLEKFP